MQKDLDTLLRSVKQKRLFSIIGLIENCFLAVRSLLKRYVGCAVLLQFLLSVAFLKLMIKPAPIRITTAQTR
jgi:hypothetical protein